MSMDELFDGSDAHLLTIKQKFGDVIPDFKTVCPKDCAELRDIAELFRQQGKIDNSEWLRAVADRYELAVELLREAIGERDQLAQALRELVTLKDMKEQIIELAVPNTPESPFLSALNETYKRRQPLAWKAARSVLAKYEAP